MFLNNMTVLYYVINSIESSNILGVHLNFFLLLLIFFLASDAFLLNLMLLYFLVVFLNHVRELYCMNTKKFSRVYIGVFRKNPSHQGESARAIPFTTRIFIPHRRDLGKINQDLAYLGCLASQINTQIQKQVFHK